MCFSGPDGRESAGAESLWFTVGVDAFDQRTGAEYAPMELMGDDASSPGYADARARCLVELISSVDAGCAIDDFTHATRCGIVVEDHPAAYKDTKLKG